MLSQSQSQQQHQQIPLGQHSDNGESQPRAEGEAAAAEMLLSGASTDSKEGVRISDRMKGESVGGHGGGRAGAATFFEGGRGQSRDGVDKQGSYPRRRAAGKDRGDLATPSSTSTQQEASVGTLYAGNYEGRGCSKDKMVSGGGGTEETEVPAALLGDKYSTNKIALPGRGGDAAGSDSSRRVALSPGGGAGGPAHSRSTTQPTPSRDSEQPIPTAPDEKRTAIGVGGARLDGSGAPATVSSSIWADLDGLASGDDSTSDDTDRNDLATASGSLTMPSLLQGRALSNIATVVSTAAGKTDRGAAAVAGATVSNGLERGDMQVMSGGVSPAAGGAGRGTIASGTAGFSLLAGAGGNLRDDDLLDAALEDSE